MTNKREHKRIWDKKPKGIMLISEEEFDKWLAERKDYCAACQSDYAEVKADAEIVRKTVYFERDKEYLSGFRKGSLVIYSKEAWDECREKAKKWDMIERDPDAKIIISEVFDELNREKEKLESIREHFAKQGVYSGRWPFGPARVGRWRAKLEKILGG